jgi:DNA ligase-1
VVLAPPADADGDDDYAVSDEDDEDDIEDKEEGPPADGLAKVMSASVSKKAKVSKASKKGDKKGDPNGVGDRSVEAAGRLLTYDPASAADWPKGAPAPYLFLANVFENISETTKRLEIAEMLTNAFRTILHNSTEGSHEDLLAAVYLASNAIAPQHSGVDLGIGDATLIKALAEGDGAERERDQVRLQERG